MAADRPRRWIYHRNYLRLPAEVPVLKLTAAKVGRWLEAWRGVEMAALRELPHSTPKEWRDTLEAAALDAEWERIRPIDHAGWNGSEPHAE